MNRGLAGTPLRWGVARIARIGGDGLDLRVRLDELHEGGNLRRELAGGAPVAGLIAHRLHLSQNAPRTAIALKNPALPLHRECRIHDTIDGARQRDRIHRVYFFDTEHPPT